MRPNTFSALRQLRRAPLLNTESSLLRCPQQALLPRCASTSTTAKPVNGNQRQPAARSATTSPRPTTVYSNRGVRPAPTFNGMSVDDVDTSLDPLPTIPTPQPSSTPATEAASDFVQAVQSTSPSFGAGSNGNGDGDSSSIDWSSSFHGLSTTAFEPSVAAILMAPLDTEDVEIKPDGIAYLPEIKYRRILNQAFGPGGWGLAPRGELVVGEKVVTREYALVVHGR